MTLFGDLFSAISGSVGFSPCCDAGPYLQIFCAVEGAGCA